MGIWTGYKLEREYVKAVYCHPAYFNLHAEFVMRNAGLDEAQAGIKIAGRNISNLRYADDTTLMTESEEELKILLMKVKEESEKAGLKFNIQKKKISWHLVPSVQFSHSVVCDSVTPWTAACQSFLSITNSRSLFKLISIAWVMPSNHLILCCPPFPPAFNLSQHQGLFQ